MFNPLKLLNDPEYQKLSPDEQRTARQMYFERVLSKDTYYTSLSSVAQESLKKQFNIEPEKKAGRTLKERIGFEGPGLVEGLTGSQLGKVVDIPLRVLGIPGALAGSTVEDITGSGSLGGLTRLGVDLFLGAKGLGALKSLRAGKGAIPATTGEMSISAPMAEASGQLTLPGISGIGAKAPSFEEGALRAKAALGKIEGLTKPQTSRELQLSMQKGSLEAEQLELNLARPDWRMERYPNVGIKLVGSANAAFEKLWGREQGAAEAFRQLWGQKGKTGAGLLPIGAGAAVGGAIGGLTAESPEDRMRNALIGAGIGGATAGVLLGIGRSKPVLAGLGGALIKEAGGYQAVTKTGKVAGIIETDALPIQISEAAKLGARAKNSLPSGLRDAVDALDGDGINLTIFKAKTRLEQLTPRIFGVNPRDLARNIPGMGPIANTLEEAADYAKAFEGWFVENVNTIYKPLTKKHSSIEKVNAFLDGQKVTLTGTEQSVAANARVLYDKAFALLGIPEEKRVLDYFTRLRKTVAVDSAYVTMGGRDIPIRGMIELVEGNLYVPLRVESSLPKNYTPFFMKERTTELAATDLGMAPMLAYARGFGRRLALSGGINPYTGEQVVGALSKLKNQLPNLPDNSEVLQYNAKWINQFLGVPTGVRGGAFGANTEMVVAEMKKWQFLRTLALNPLSAMLNLTQSLNTFAKSSVGSWLGAFNDMLDPAKRLMAKQQGIVGELAKADIDALTQTPFTELSARLLQKAGFMFSKSETMVRQHAFFTGLRDAAKRGLIGEDALTYARKLTSETQYRFGKEGLPATFREQGAGQLLSQFKTYPVNQMLFMKNLLVDDIADLRKMQGIPFKRMSKFFGSTIALVGSDAATLGLDKSISKFFTDNEETLRVTGFFPWLFPLYGNVFGRTTRNGRPSS